ncbi:DUF6603 domain-containing protein [Streptomyces fungicidicus]|uniref:DUF6603 domain-containing protein n=1 Tax=Streptomyces TaxID=1883 RepID=UPI0033991180
MGIQAFAQDLVGAVLGTLEPLIAAGSDEAALRILLADLGWAPPETPPATDSLGSVRTVTEQAKEATEAFGAFIVGGGDWAALVQQVREVVTAVEGLSATDGTGLPAPLNEGTFWASLATELPGYLLTDRLRREKPPLYALLLLTGVITRQRVAPSRYRTEGAWITEVHWERLALLVTDPSELAHRAYGWGGQLDVDKLLRAVQDVAHAFGLPAIRVTPELGLFQQYFGTPADPLPEPPPLLLRVPLAAVQAADGDAAAYGEAGLVLLPVPPVPGAAPDGLLFGPYAAGAVQAVLHPGETVEVQLTGGVDTTGALGVVLRPDGLVPRADGGEVGGGFGVALDWRPPGPVKVLGDPASAGVTLGGARVAATVTTVGASVDEVAVSVAVRKLRVVLDLSALDGLLASVAGGRSIEAESDVELVWSSRTGLTLRGSGRLEKTFPLHLDLGPVRVTALTLRGTADGDGLRLAATVDLTARLGPVAATVEGAGAALAVTPAPDGGLLFGLDADLGLVPPIGAGLVVKAGPVDGGGHLFLDREKGQYAGVFQLGLAGAGGLSAWRLQGVAVLNTRATDGSPLHEANGDGTFSLLVSGTYEWTPGIALGWGVFVNGLGLVVGHNRRVDVEEVRKATRTGALDALLFPADPVANAPAVIDTLGRIFPPDTTGTVLGVMVRLEMLGQLLTAKLAVLIEFPEPIRVLVLGQLVLDLRQAGRLRLDTVGVIDFDRGELSLDGSLVDSELFGRQITGDLALRVRWHGDGAFALSLGGFHPGFRPPAGFPALRRLAIALNGTGRISAYLAVTSNTVQFGGAIDLSIKFWKIALEGHAQLDALMRFDPFWFTAELGAKVTLSVFGKTLLGVDLLIGVSGPQPWGFWGHVKLKLLFLSISKPFDTRKPGQAAPPELEPVRAVEQLRLALARPDAWEITTGGGGAEPVVLRSPELPERLVLRPGTLLGLRQNVLPLGVTVERLGAARVSGPNRFDVRSFTLGNGLDGTVGDPILDRFAPGQFRDLEPAELLEQSGYQWQETGRRLGLPDGSDLPAAGLTVAAALDGDDAYDAWIVDDVAAPPRPLPPAAAGSGAADSGRLLAGFARTGPAADAATRTGGAALFTGAGLGLTRD